ALVKWAKTKSTLGPQLQTREQIFGFATTALSLNKQEEGVGYHIAFWSSLPEALPQTIKEPARAKVLASIMEELYLPDGFESSDRAFFIAHAMGPEKVIGKTDGPSGWRWDSKLPFEAVVGDAFVTVSEDGEVQAFLRGVWSSCGTINRDHGHDDVVRGFDKYRKSTWRSGVLKQPLLYTMPLDSAILKYVGK
ncbi:unnamed protein product, partial [Symbiodinium pilosum]